MKVLVTGVLGQLGFDVVKELNKRNIECKGIDIKDCNLCNGSDVEKVVTDYMPDAIIHCAAYTAVDKAETEKEACRMVNVDGTKNIAEAAKKCDAKIIYISTDYVFKGDGETPFETEDAKAPQNEYGKTKSAGEDVVASITDKHFIVRTSWVFGINGNNFINTMLRLGSEKEELSVVCDQIGSPTYTQDLAKLLCDMAVTDKYGIYHATNEGYCSWFEFAAKIMQLSGRKCVVKPVTTAEYKTAAVRPLNSRLSKKELDENGFERLPLWEDALIRYLKEKNEI